MTPSNHQRFLEVRSRPRWRCQKEALPRTCGSLAGASCRILAAFFFCCRLRDQGTLGEVEGVVGEAGVRMVVRLRGEETGGRMVSEQTVVLSHDRDKPGGDSADERGV